MEQKQAEMLYTNLNLHMYSFCTKEQNSIYLCKEEEEEEENTQSTSTKTATSRWNYITSHHITSQ